MATLLGRIRRISNDAGNPVNYTVEATSDYDALNPAATVADWGTDIDDSALDQDVTIPVPPAPEIAHEGALITFLRETFVFNGVVVKIRPTYDFGAGENPFLELWTHDSVALEWTRRKRVQLASGFVGVPTGQAKYFGVDDTWFLAVPQSNVDMVWVTMDPGATGTPTMRFVALHVFGECRLIPKTSGDCHDNPTIDCKNPDDNTPNNPKTCEQLVEAGEVDPEVCEEPTPNFPGLPPDAGGPTPRTEPPDFPLIDLCSPEEIEAAKATMTPEQLEFFEQMLDQSELPCLGEDGEPPLAAPINEDPDETGTPVLPQQPIEKYIDPTTLEPAADPRGGGAGSDPAEYATTVHRHFFFFSSSFRQATFESNLLDEDQAIIDAWNDPLRQVAVFGTEPPGDGSGFALPALDQIVFTVHGVSAGDLIGVVALTRVEGSIPIIFKGYGASKLAGSISASEIVDFLIQRGSRLNGIPGSSAEAGGDASATVSQSRGIVVTGLASAAIQLTVVTALDHGAHAFGGFATESDEVADGGGVGTIGGNRKHLSTGADVSGPPFTNPGSASRYSGVYFRIDVTKKLGGFNTDPHDSNGQPVPTGTRSVYATMSHTTTTS